MWVLVILLVLVVAAAAYLMFTKGSSTIDEKSLRERHRNIEKEANLMRRPNYDE
ncbi:MAG TPA: hypothetical protein VH419_17020 [Nocardioidaceae bacterium]|jgi:hypothetical protein